jgi:hypothetical protein
MPIVEGSVSDLFGKPLFFALYDWFLEVKPLSFALFLSLQFCHNPWTSAIFMSANKLEIQRSPCKFLTFSESLKMVQVALIGQSVSIAVVHSSFVTTVAVVTRKPSHQLPKSKVYNIMNMVRWQQYFLFYGNWVSRWMVDDRFPYFCLLHLFSAFSIGYNLYYYDWLSTCLSWGIHTVFLRLWRLIYYVLIERDLNSGFQSLHLLESMIHYVVL